jgi:hypothetical protein
MLGSDAELSDFDDIEEEEQDDANEAQSAFKDILKSMKLISFNKCCICVFFFGFSFFCILCYYFQVARFLMQP